jgi:hypothetical protein
MEYGDAIIRRLRDRLLRYRSETRIGGRKRPWHQVAMAIADAESVPRAFYDKEDDFAVLGEALRRFGAGTQVLSRERLDALSAFLKEKGYLTETDLEQADAPVQVLHGLAAFFGNGSLPDPQALCGDYLAARHGGGRNEYRLLTIALNGSGALEAEEVTHVTTARTHARHPVELHRFFKVASTAMTRCDGWAVALAAGPVLILVRDRLSGAGALRTLFPDDDGDAQDTARALHILEHGPFSLGRRTIRIGGEARDEPAIPDLVAAWTQWNSWRFERQEPVR